MIKYTIKTLKYRIRRCLVSPKDRHFAKLGGGLDKGDFYFINKFTFKKNWK